MITTTAAAGSLLPLTVALPLTGAVLAPLLARLSKRLPLIVSALGLVGSLAVLALIAPHVYGTGGGILAHYMGGWGPVHGAVLGIAFAADPFGMTFALVCAGIGTLLVVYALSELGGLGERELGAFACLFQLLDAALIGSALTADLFNLFVWFEVAALASYGLTGFFLERPIALEAAFKIAILTTVAAFAVFIGAGLLYTGHGALNLAQLHDALAAHVGTADLVALGLLVAGFGTKAGLIPFHGWLPDAHTAAPGPVSALFSGLMVNLGIVAVGRLAFQVFPTSRTPILGILMVVGVVSALVGATMALAQDELKRLLAYDTISQMGVLAIGLATGAASGIAGSTYHLVNHALFKSLLFLCAGAITHRTGVTKLSEMGGLLRRWPWVAGAFVVGCASIAGIPPLGGYVSLSLIHHGLLESHQYLPYALMLVAQLITIAALGRAAWLAFFREREEEYERSESLRPGMLISLLALSACCIAFGVVPGTVIDHAMAPAASGLLHPQQYAHDVLAGVGSLSHVVVDFNYTDLMELVLIVVSVGLGALLTVGYLRSKEPLPVRALRAVHTGSINDYAAFLAAGAVAIIAALRWA
ncbi:MAG TPA: proton-conducting transporter membrane subunit [Actinocrinis sp.]|uniref:complex I subunit 5 family protein n=1 Tax=Actinocrinis sp. TaxID=1920516 RepID=UPI002D522DD7|nr:proton-conducting transporter membrane subunit [Actinocrinis sp.]HZU56584.1 proton-conducting transporter membrane subunit [Actinocrinis sp.]